MLKKTNETKKFWNPLNLILISAFIGISACFYIGFFFPDVIYSNVYNTKPLQYKIWLVFPITIFVIIVLYRAVYLKMLKLGSLVLLFFLVLLLLLLKFQISEYKYAKNLNERIKNFHTYLQLTPPQLILKPNSNCNIFCMGGSTTEFKDKSGRDWPSMVEEKMNLDSTFSNVKVYNCGKQWYSSQHILFNYIQNLKDLKPDVIIVMENINDLLHNADFSTFSLGEFREDYGHFLGPLRNIIKNSNYSNSFLTSLKMSWYQEQDIKTIDADQFPGLISFERNLKILIQLAKADDTVVILMTQPNIYKEMMSEDELKALHMLNNEAVGNGKKWSYKTAYTGLNAYNNKIRQIASAEDVILIDLEKNIPKSLDYFFDDVHYQSKAYDLISSYLAPEIKQILTKHNLPVKNKKSD